MNAEPLEVEVKLAVSRPRTVARVLRQPDPTRLAGFRADGEVHLVRLTDRYLDTDPMAGSLATRGMRARLRSVGATVVLTVKRSGVERDGVTTRVELEAPATRSLDAGRWPESDARTAFVDGTDGRVVVEIARLRQRRLTRLLRRASTVVEVSLDRLEAIDRGRVVARRDELEAELVEGDHGALVELAGALAGIDGVGPPAGSKLQFALDAQAANRAAEGRFRPPTLPER